MTTGLSGKFDVMQAWVWGLPAFFLANGLAVFLLVYAGLKYFDRNSWPHWVRRRRIARGLCPTCGYDSRHP